MYLSVEWGNGTTEVFTEFFFLHFFSQKNFYGMKKTTEILLSKGFKLLNSSLLKNGITIYYGKQKQKF
jgi:hypothetical protein